MPRLVSNSIDETLLPSSKNAYTQKAQNSRLSHAVSAVELRGSQQPEYIDPISRKRKGLQRRRRAASSFPLSNISHNAQRPLSKRESSNEKGSHSSFPASDVDETSTPISGLSNPCSAYPSPPASEPDESFTGSASDDSENDVTDDLPFPLDPVPIPALNFPAAARIELPRTPTRRWASTQTPPLTPTRTPDRYISNRLTPQEPSKTFRVSKSPNQLSLPEKLLRHQSASPDPFGPLIIPRLRDTRSNAQDGLPSPATHPRHPRPIGTTNVTVVPDPSPLQDRHASAGAVWNIGGSNLSHHPGPIRSVSNGRGGFVSGGSNAPMYTSQFFDDNTSDQDLERMEARLAAAFDIDQTVRMLDFSRFPESSRSLSTGGIGSKRKRPYVEPRTRWMYGNWINEEYQSRKCISTWNLNQLPFGR